MSLHPTAFCSSYKLPDPGHFQAFLLLTSNYHHSIRLESHNLPVGTYGVYHNGFLAEKHSVDWPGDNFEVCVQIGGVDFDLVLLKA